MSISNDKLLNMLERMLRIRHFDDKIAELTTKGRRLGMTHLYCGEEAVAVGVCANLRDDDYITSTHRGHGHCIAKGTDVKYMMAELFAKKTGTNKGKGGSMHISERRLGNLGANGIVGAGIPIATGAALASKLRGTDQVAVSFFGDGASNQGTFHESLNMAAIWKLPALYVCENNQFGMSTPVTTSTSVKDVSIRAQGYGIPGITVDGMNVLSVYDAAHGAVERARKGLGPTLIECKTYRFYGHSGAWVIEPFETSPYRTKEEIEEWRKRDPILQLKSRLLAEGTLTEAAFGELDSNVRKEIEEAVLFAEQSPSPSPEDALTDILSVGRWDNP